MSTSTLQRSAELQSAASSPASAGTRSMWRLILLSFVGWSLLAAIPTTAAYIGSGAPGFRAWWNIFRNIGLYYYLWALLSPLIYRLTVALPGRGPGLLLTGIVHLFVFVCLSFALGFVTHPGTWQQWLFGARAAGYHSMSAFTYALVVLCCLSLKFYRLSLLRQREASDARIHAARLDSKLNLARVDTLRMQMNPHFLFNALNSIAALIDTDRRDHAYQAVEQLGDLLRRALSLSQLAEVPLHEELAFTRAYLSLEQLRYGKRLRVDWLISERTESLEVPAFVLQPLVENAIKHAVGPSGTTVTVTISARLVDDVLVLGVLDDAAAASASAHVGAGLGIGNLRARLRLRYGSGATVDAGRRETGYAALVSLPRPPRDAVCSS